jgi:hypothetical protein
MSKNVFIRKEEKKSLSYLGCGAAFASTTANRRESNDRSVRSSAPSLDVTVAEAMNIYGSWLGSEELGKPVLAILVWKILRENHAREFYARFAHRHFARRQQRFTA